MRHNGSPQKQKRSLPRPLMTSILQLLFYNGSFTTALTQLL
jgi:hypothetical protein